MIKRFLDWCCGTRTAKIIDALVRGYHQERDPVVQHRVELKETAIRSAREMHRVKRGVSRFEDLQFPERTNAENGS
jgi:hypothetical protein